MNVTKRDDGDSDSDSDDDGGEIEYGTECRYGQLMGRKLQRGFLRWLVG